MAAANVFPMPQSLVMDESTATNKYAKFTAQPFQSGFGHTIGNSLRRVLLSSLEGAAIPMNLQRFPVLLKMSPRLF